MKRWRDLGRLVFLLMILTATALIAYAALRVYRTLEELDDLRASLSSVAQDVRRYDQIEQQYHTLATELPLKLEELDRLLFVCVIRRDAESQARFREQGAALEAWIKERQQTVFRSKLVIGAPLSFNVEVGQLTDEIAFAYARYLKEAQRAIVQSRPNGATSVDAEALLEVWGRSRELFALAGQARVNAELIRSFLSGSTGWLPRLDVLMSQWLPQLVVLLVVAAALGALSLGGLAVLTIVTPLRIRMRQRELILEQQTKLAHLGELAAGLAHEIRNPLTAINARLFTLQRELASGSEESHDAEIIRAEVKRLDRIVRDFLDLARPADPERTTVMVKTLLGETHELLAPTLEKQGIELHVDADEDEAVQVDPQQIKQVLINLVQNAADSLQDEGRVSLRAHSADTSKGTRRKMVEIEIADNGSGIPEAIRDKLFDPFFSTKNGGTGLGLAIAKRILDRHGGGIDFESSVGKGTVFRIWLPVETATSGDHGTRTDS